MQLSVNVTGRQTGGVWYDKRWNYSIIQQRRSRKNKAGTVVLTAPTKTVVVKNDVTWDVNVVLVGSSLIINVNGNAGNTISWECLVKLKTPGQVLTN